ncbi:MAG: sulfatase [Promethearchaeota archaeon]
MRIIYFDIDTLRPDHLGCYGYHRNTSPNIDKIAEQGTIFTNCYASDAPCLPSRASLFTGRFGIHTGIVGHGGTAADMRLTGKERGFDDNYLRNNWIGTLRNAKYYTVSISPFAERHSAFWFCSGWNEMYNPGKRGHELADDVFPFAKKWLEDNGKKDNWFLHLNLWDPHTPYRTPLSFEPSFENDPPPSWITENIIKKHRNSHGPRSARDIGGFDRLKLTQFYKRIQNIREIENLDDFTRWINAYDVGIRYTDEFVGNIIEIIKNLEIYRDTLIIISSDHGESQGELNVYGDHATACHIVNRVPMIIKWPNKSWKKQYDSFLYATDIAATIIEGVGKNVPNFWDGKSIYKEIENGEEFGRSYLVLSQNAWTCQRTVRFGNWTLIRTYHTGLRDYPEIMLYNFENDFHMTKNLAEERPDIVGKGLQLLDEWHKQMMKTSPSPKDPLWTVIEEGGPHHTKKMLNTYIRRLRRSGREELIKVIQDRKESD